MHLPANIGPWDAVLVTAVSLQATAVAYLRQPRWKALAFMIPLPFTCAYLAVGEPIGSGHVGGLILLFGFTLAVRGLYLGLGVPIVASIAATDVCYCLLAGGVRPHLPTSAAGFWVTAAAALGVGIVGRWLMPPRDEPGHRTTLPIWIKLPLIAAVVCCLVAIKVDLQGLMVMFPFVATIAIYESRHSLWTFCRAIPGLIFLFVPMMITIHLTQPALGRPAALTAGWVVYVTLLLPQIRRALAVIPVPDDTGGACSSSELTGQSAPVS